MDGNTGRLAPEKKSTALKSTIKKAKPTLKSGLVGENLCRDLVPLGYRASAFQKTAGLAAFEKTRRTCQKFYDEELPAFRSWFLLEFRDMIWQLQELEERLNRQKDSTKYERPATLLDWLYYKSTFEPLRDDLWIRKEAMPSVQKKMHRSKEQVAAQSKMKSIYCELARNLHPDKFPLSQAKGCSLWHECQRAYQARDHDYLQMLQAYVRVLARNSKKSAGNEKEIKNGMKVFETEAHVASKLHAWNFLAQKREPLQLEKLKSKISRELKARSRELNEELKKTRLKIVPKPRPTEGDDEQFSLAF